MIHFYYIESKTAHTQDSFGVDEYSWTPKGQFKGAVYQQQSEELADTYEGVFEAPINETDRIIGPNAEEYLVESIKKIGHKTIATLKLRKKA